MLWHNSCKIEFQGCYSNNPTNFFKLLKIHFIEKEENIAVFLKEIMHAPI